MSGLSKFHFDGDAIDVQMDGQDVYVSVRRVCDALGVDYPTQQTKLKEKEWATIGLCPTVADDGKRRQMTMLHLDSLPMWLATIDAKRVKPEVRPKLLRYQRECAKVLADHFLGRRMPHQLTPAYDVARLYELSLVSKVEARQMLGLSSTQDVYSNKEESCKWMLESISAREITRAALWDLSQGQVTRRELYAAARKLGWKDTKRRGVRWLVLR